MREIEIPLTGGAPRIDRSIAHSGLSIVMRGSLKKFPGSVHWHVKRGKEGGTLKITYWPERNRAWFTVQNGRKGQWIDPAIEDLMKRLKKQDPRQRRQP